MFFNQQKVTRGQVPKKVVWRRRFYFVKNLFFVFVIGLVFYQTYAIYTLQNPIGKYGEFEQLAPTQEVSNEEPVVDDTVEDVTSSQLKANLLDLVSGIAGDEKVKSQLAKIESDYKLLDQKLNLPEGYDVIGWQIVAQTSGLVLFDFGVDNETGEYILSDPTQQTRTSDQKAYLQTIGELSKPEKLQSLLRLAQIKRDLRASLLEELEKPKTKQLLADKNLTYNEIATAVSFDTINAPGLLLLSFDPINKAYVPNGNKEEEFVVADLTTKLGQLIAKIDTRTEFAKITDEQKSEFQKVIASEEFAKALADNGLVLVNSEEKPDGLYYQFNSDKYDSEFTIILEQGTGAVKILRGKEVIDMDDFLAEGKKKSLDIPKDFGVNGNAADRVYLLAGKHGSLTDTIMIAYVFDEQESVKLVSLPRDLAWQGRKINSYYADGGMDKLIPQLEKILQVRFENHALVDMYAFIDVVNILGGVNITLDEAVVDPTYKTFDNGVWGTLNYQPGTYHLNGVQALRLARSRNSSSDFARADRQQQILKALQKKAQKLSIKDLPKIIALAQAVLSKLDSDIGITEAVDLYKQHKNYDVVNAGVLSSGNILYSTYSNQSGFERCLAIAETSAQKGRCSKGAYILLPKNNNWQAIPWYITQLLQG